MLTHIRLAIIGGLTLLVSLTALKAQTSYVEYLRQSSPSLSASYQLSQQVDGWFKEIDQAVADYNRKYPNGNPEAEARGRAYLMGMQGAYQVQQDASIERRRIQLKRAYTDTYNKAKAWRDYYYRHGAYQQARQMQQVMDNYNPTQFR